MGQLAIAISILANLISLVRTGPPYIYPPSTQFGAINPSITQSNIDKTICNPKWSTKLIRPSEAYTEEIKKQQLSDGRKDTNPSDYEEDHLIPLELGGSPTSTENLWPEPYVTSIKDGGARSKDLVENFLHDQVCSQKMTLQEAQQKIVIDWYVVRKIVEK